MGKYTIKLLWIFVILACIAGYQVALGRLMLPAAGVYVYDVFFAAAMLAWLYLTIRILLFGRNLDRFVKRMTANEYEAGITISRLFNDELTVLARRINKMADQLCVYDSLQRERISVVSRALDVVYHTVKYGVIVFDIKTREFRFNPAAQAAFAVEQEAVAYAAIALQGGNAKFMELLRSAIEKGALVTDAAVSLELPVRQTRRELVISITPIKDKNETVDLAIIFFSGSGG